MIDVRVRQHDRVDRRRVDRKRAPVALAQLLGALKQATVDEHAGAPMLDQVTRASHGVGGAEEGQLHELTLEWR